MGSSQDHAPGAGAVRVEGAPRHTPGPWVYINSKPEGAPEWMSVQKFVKSLTAVVENDRGPNYARCILEDEDYPEKDADGALIAAAPDLLDALRDARDRMVGSSPGLKALIAKTDAAIAKALGAERAPLRAAQTVEDASGMNPESGG